MKRITLKVRDFTGDIVLLAGGDISNGHWALRASAVENAQAFASVELAKAFGIATARAFLTTSFDKLGTLDERHEWTGTVWFYESRNSVMSRVFQSTKTGEYAGINRRYLSLAGLDEYGASLYGIKPHRSFTDALTTADSRFLVMSVRLPAFPPPATIPKPEDT